MERSIVWDCPNCNERNYTRRDAARPTCQQCESVYEWNSKEFAFAASHEETVDDDGNFDADIWIPDFDEDVYPDEDIPDNPDFEGHVGFYAATDDGIPFHVLGDPNMSDKTMKALGELVKAAHKAIEEGTIVPDDEDTGYSPEDRETLRKDWERIYQDRYDNAPPDLPIALSDAEIEAAEDEDREFASCTWCGKLPDECQCFEGSEE